MRKNIIDVSELHDRAKELRDERDALEGMPLREWEEEYGEDLKEIEVILEECGDGPLIHEDYFTKYVEELCNDIGDTSGLPWYVVVDWEATANNVMLDFTTVDFEDEIYYYNHC